MTDDRVTASPVTVALPTADRRTTYEFYGAGLGLETIGPLADDGVPEPLQFVVNEGLRLMFVPTGGFGWIAGGHEVAEPGTSECMLVIGAATDAEVDAIIAKAVAAGAKTVIDPAAQSWGYAGSFADPDGHLWMVRADDGSG